MLTAYQVDNYRLYWNHTTHRGRIRIVVEEMFSGSKATHWANDLPFEDYMAMPDMLRNEKPLYYSGSQLSTKSGEVVGEEET